MKGHPNTRQLDQLVSCPDSKVEMLFVTRKFTLRTPDTLFPRWRGGLGTRLCVMQGFIQNLDMLSVWSLNHLFGKLGVSNL